MKKIAIIGAGLAGLTLASRLARLADVVVLEKSAGFGGRMATRRADQFQFDHGAQYFTARSSEFKQFLKHHLPEDAVSDWQPRVVTLGNGEKPYTRPWFEPHWVGMPGMNSIGRQLASTLPVELQAHAKTLTRDGGDWSVGLTDGRDLGPFDWVISTQPAPQASKLLPEQFAMHDRLDKVRMSACYSMMLGFLQAPPLRFQAARIIESPLGWLAVDSHKPARPDSFSLLVQSTNEWADQTLDMPLDEVESRMLSALTALLPDLPRPDHLAMHRWRYAATAEPLGQDFLLDAKQQLAACGDWCLGGRVEAAFTSACRLAAAMERHL